MEPKTYIIVRADLPPGLLAAQACHAAILFTARHGILSDNLALLAAPDEAGLLALIERAARAGIRLAAFYEPDLGGTLTAIALDSRGKKLVSSLPLALRGARGHGHFKMQALTERAS